MRALIWAAALLTTGCSAEFWAMGPPTWVAPDPGVAATLRIERIEVRSAFYSPPDAFSEVFIPAVRARTDACARGSRGVRAVVFIHELDRGSALTDGGDRIVLPGSVDLRDDRDRLIARFPVRVDVPLVAGDVTARRRAASDAFGQAICAELAGG